MRRCEDYLSSCPQCLDTNPQHLSYDLSVALHCCSINPRIVHLVCVAPSFLAWPNVASPKRHPWKTSRCARLSTPALSRCALLFRPDKLLAHLVQLSSVIH